MLAAEHCAAGPRCYQYLRLKMRGWCWLPLLLGLYAPARSQSPYQTTHWQFAGPTAVYDPLTLSAGMVAGPVTAIAADNNLIGKAYIGSWDGGVWETSDGGYTWQPLTDAMPDLAIGALAMAPSNHTVLYAGTGTTALSGPLIAGDGLLYSANGGTSWAVIGRANFQGLAITQIRVDPNDAQHLLVAAAALPGSSLTGGGLYASSDSGSSWQKLMAGDCRDFYWWPAQQAIVADQNGSIVISTNDGASFQAPMAAPASGYLRVAFGVSLAAPNTIWALEANAQGNFGGLYESADRGLDWVQVNVQNTFFMEHLFGQGQGKNDIVLALDPVSGTLYAGGVDLWSSSDNGANWTNLTNTQSNSPTVHAGQHAISFGYAPSGFPPRLWLGNDGGVWSNPNPGGSMGFTNLNASLSIMGITRLAAAGSVMLAATATEGFAETVNAGEWTTMTTLASGSAALAADGTGGGFALAAQAQALKINSSGGAPFIQEFKYTPNPSQDAGMAAQNPPLWSNPALATSLYIATDQLWASGDGGITWSMVSGSQARTTLSALAAAPPLIAEGSEQGQVLESGNQGLTWSDLSAGLPQRPITGMAWSAANVLVAAFGGTDQILPAGHVFADISGGWVDISASLPDRTITALAADPQDASVLYASNESGVWATPDLGGHWVLLGQGLPGSQVEALVLRPKARELLAATAGRGVWSFALEPAAATAVTVAGNDQTADTGATLPQTLTAQVLNAFGEPVSGQNVTWTDNSAGGGFSATQAVSDAQGFVSTTYTLPARAGTVTVMAMPILSGSSWTADFQETAVATTATTLLAYSGSGQSQTVGLPLPMPLVTRVEDSMSNPIAGFTVNYSDGNAGGSFSPAAAVSDASGNASTIYTLPPNAGQITITAAGGSLAPVQFTATALAAPSFTLSLSPAAQDANANTIAQIQLNSQSIGGDSKTILLNCTAPVTGCSLSPSSIAPGGSSSVSVGTGSLTAGSNTITISGTDGVHTQTASATITLTGMSLQSTPSTASVAAGQTASFALNLSGEGGFSGQASLACSNNGGALPYGMACSFNPSTSALGSSPVTISLAVSTTAPGSVPPAMPAPRRPAVWLGAGALLVLLAGAFRRRRMLRLAGLAGIAAVALACGGGGSYSQPPPPAPGTPPGTYNIVVTASASGVTPQQTTLSITVQ